MEYIEGFHLDDDLYKSLDISLQEKAGKALGTQFQALRAVPSEGYYGRVNNQGWPAAEILAEGPSEENPDILGPYSSYEQFINMLYNSALFKAATLRVQSDYGKEQLLILRNFIYSLSCVPESERVPVLFHRDIHWQNIIFTEVRSPSGEVCDYKATLIDLERLSWLPKWMQLGMLDLFTKFAFRNFYLEAAKALEPLNVPMGKWLCDHLMREVFVVL
ncbi:hypothetical protein P154DRAFT_152531 [Amniculicola lignicola CBS 123094]|uniref:Aminoglycoside phosphotransferase domain-containing protein n=1 Tax=Amniculicola lignicola CBS 123094 TaxID=1392246 RepID=A0A6A5WK33_9PLEO|nr:hypothetical protein P154DRAFT_152531 [Amniculicola lignicola CBS 123094]